MKRLFGRSAILGASAILLLGACSPPLSQEETLVVADDECAVETACDAVIEDAATVAVEEAAELVEYLFIQHADGVRLADGKLFLDSISDSVMYFSDRPYRIVGREPLAAFLEAWDEGESSFEVIPPNAIVTVVRDAVARDLAVVLRNPMLDGSTLVYDVDILDGPEAGEGAFATVFIDGLGRPLRGGEPGIPGAEIGRPGRPGDAIPGAELGKPGRPDVDRDIDRDLDPDIAGSPGVRANPKGRKMLKAEAADRIF